MAGHPVASLLDDVAAGRFPAPDGSVTILPQPSPRYAGVFAFTAHSVVFADADPAWIRGQLPPGDLAAPMLPAFLQALADRTGRRVSSHDLLCVAAQLAGPSPFELSPLAVTADAGHPRVTRAMRYRTDVRVCQAAGGVVVVGRGVAGRWEAAVEVDPNCQGRGLGRELATAARHLVPDGAPVWAQIAPGNAASVRAFLAAGFAPVGAEALLLPAG
jgi:GNAT superfamily N-acetyltransferase